MRKKRIFNKVGAVFSIIPSKHYTHSSLTSLVYSNCCHQLFCRRRGLLSQPPKIEGLGIQIFSEIADFELVNSRLVTETLTMKIIDSEDEFLKSKILRYLYETPLTQQYIKKQ